MTAGAEAQVLTDRELDRVTIAELVKGSVETVEGGNMDGVEVLRLATVLEILATAPRLPASAYAAELSTDKETEGRVLVWVFCPRCGIGQPISAFVGGRLTTQGDVNELKPVFRVKARTHLCDQTPLPLDESVAGQVKAWDIKDITGDAPGEGDEEDEK